MFCKPSPSFHLHEKYQKQRKLAQTLSYIYVPFPRCINNPPAGKERDCHDQKIAY